MDRRTFLAGTVGTLAAVPASARLVAAFGGADRFPLVAGGRAVPLDDASPQTVNVTVATGADDTGMNRQWERNTSDNVNRTSTRHAIDAPGGHALKVWMVDPTVVVQKIVVDTGGLRPSYLGPPESMELRAGRPVLRR